MNTVSTILYVIMMIVTAIFVFGIFVQSNKEMWENFKKDYTPWFKHTKVGMWYYNRKNGVKILSDREFDNIQKSGKVIYIETEE